MELEAEAEALETALAIEDETLEAESAIEDIIELTVELLETALVKALEMAEVGIALGINAAGSVIKEVPFKTAKGVGMAVTPADDKALWITAVGTIPADERAL